ncbi:DUF397 domain-containing protein [Streptomyces olivaceus]
MLDFVKSSYSNTAGECVEVAFNIPETVAVRDSKAPSTARYSALPRPSPPGPVHRPSSPRPAGRRSGRLGRAPFELQANVQRSNRTSALAL